MWLSVWVGHRKDRNVLDNLLSILTTCCRYRYYLKYSQILLCPHVRLPHPNMEVVG
jgi:hypothetical protein